MKRILFLALLFIWFCGCNLAERVPLNPVKPDAAPVVPARSEQDYWKEIAACVTTGCYQNTDQVVLAAGHLKTRGVLKDMSRLSGFEARRQEITDENKSAVAATLTGS